MAEKLRRWINRGLAAALLLAGGIVTVVLIRTRPEPQRQQRSTLPPAVAVIPVTPQRFCAPVIGYGSVQAKRTVPIVPEVGGRLRQVHADMGQGKIVRKGELLFEIDPSLYEAQVKQGEAEVRRLEITLERQETQRRGLERHLETARALLKKSDANVERFRKLEADEAATTMLLDQVESEQLKQQDAIVELESSLALHPHLVAETEALLDARRSALEQAKQNVERTRIYCPFDARIEAIGAQASQVVVAYLQIATLIDLEAFELSTVIDPRELRWTDRRVYARLQGEDAGVPPDVRVSWTLFNEQMSWRGQVTRLARHDVLTRTAHVVVEIRNEDLALSTAPSPTRPTLTLGIFCRAELPAEPLEDALVIPRHAIGDDNTVLVFVPDAPGAGSEGHLEFRRVPLLRTVGDDVLVAYTANDDDAQAVEFAGRKPRVDCELKPNELVIVSPLPRATPGMRLARRQAIATVQPESAPALALDPRNEPLFSGLSAFLPLQAAPRATVASERVAVAR